MSRRHVEALRTVFDQFARGDFSAWSEVASDFQFVTSREMPDPGTYTGEEADRYRQAWLDSFEGLRMEALELIDAGDKVVAEVVQRGRPRGADAAVEGRWWQVITFRGDQVIRIENFTERAEALTAAGMPN
jgi:ketosteroid isomerase-like protein